MSKLHTVDQETSSQVLPASNQPCERRIRGERAGRPPGCRRAKASRRRRTAPRTRCRPRPGSPRRTSGAGRRRSPRDRPRPPRTTVSGATPSGAPPAGRARGPRCGGATTTRAPSRTGKPGRAQQARGLRRRERRDEQRDAERQPGLAEQEHDDDDRHQHGRADEALLHARRPPLAAEAARAAGVLVERRVEGRRAEVGPERSQK